MRVEIVHDQSNLFCLRVVFLHQTAHTFRPFTGGMIIRYLNPPPVFNRRME